MHAETASSFSEAEPESWSFGSIAGRFDDLFAGPLVRQAGAWSMAADYFQGRGRRVRDVGCGGRGELTMAEVPVL